MTNVSIISPAGDVLATVRQIRRIDALGGEAILPPGAAIPTVTGRKGHG